MGIEWFRDLSITILGFIASVGIIFGAILVYRLYREMKSTMSQINAVSKIAFETVSMVQEGIKPLLSIMTIIQAIRGGFEFVSKIFKKESNEGGECNE